MKKYYRVCKEFFGDEYTFIPENHYEHLEFNMYGEIIHRQKSKVRINEVCFSKYIPNCFFAISMFLEKDDICYIYETEQEPCIEAFKCSTGDFKSSQEVRYRKPVKSNYIGSFKVHESFLDAMKELYIENQHGEYFDSERILYMLRNNYNSIYNEINYKNAEVESRFNELKLSEQDYKFFLESLSNF